MANTMVQKFWDSALALHPAEDHDSHRFVLFFYSAYILTFEDGLITVLLYCAVTNLIRLRQHPTTQKESIYTFMLAVHSLTKLRMEKGGCTDSVVVGGL